MMAVTVSTENNYNPRTFLKLAGLFVAGLLAVLIGGLVYDVFATLAEQQKSEAEVRALPSTFAIDPKLESDLAKVMSTENTQNLADIKDPFVDQSGITQIGNSSAATTSNASAQTSAKTGATTTVAGSSSKGSTTTVGGNKAPTSGVAQTVVEKKEDTLARIIKRDEKMRLGLPVGPESTVFAIEDLLPVGVVSGGNGQEEVLLYSQSADRTFSYPIGTQFFDGWLVGVKAEGAVFNFVETKENRLKSWVRSIKTRSSTNSVVVDSPNQTLTTGGN